MKVLCITDCQDRPETELFIRLAGLLGNLTVMCNPAGRNYPLLVQAGTINVEPLKIHNRFDRLATSAIRAEVERGDYDIVHAFNTHAVACMLRGARRHRARLLAYRGVTTGVGYLKPECWHTFLDPRLDGVFCVAEAVRQAFLKTRFLCWRFPAAKARTIYKGHDPRWYQVAKVAPGEFGIPAGSKTLCCLSRNSGKKGGLTLLEAFDQLPAVLNCHLLLVGTIAANRGVRSRADRCRFPERIHFAGYRNDAPAIMRGSDLLVSASESGEGLPRVIIEAMCVGTPVVATDAGGTRELVSDGETGWLVPQRDAAALAGAITHALQQPEEMARRAAAARYRIDEFFSPASTACKTLAWYQELIER
jgi:L-malate glycosyltransferase